MADSTRKEQFERAVRGFRDAHVRGMQSLRDRDFRAFQEAVTDESAAVEEASAAIKDPPGIPARHSAVATGAGGSDPSIEAEHMRLFAQMATLEREHRELEMRPYAVDAHREHRARLHAHIAELKAHFERLRAHDPTARPAPDG